MERTPSTLDGEAIRVTFRRVVSVTCSLARVLLSTIATSFAAMMAPTINSYAADDDIGTDDEGDALHAFSVQVVRVGTGACHGLDGRPATSTSNYLRM